MIVEQLVGRPEQALTALDHAALGGAEGIGLFSLEGIDFQHGIFPQAPWRSSSITMLPMMWYLRRSK
jgi:hypothetical protein